MQFGQLTCFDACNKKLIDQLTLESTFLFNLTHIAFKWLFISYILIYWLKNIWSSSCYVINYIYEPYSAYEVLIKKLQNCIIYEKHLEQNKSKCADDQQGQFSSCVVSQVYLNVTPKWVLTSKSSQILCSILLTNQEWYALGLENVLIRI